MAVNVKLSEFNVTIKDGGGIISSEVCEDTGVTKVRYNSTISNTVTINGTPLKAVYRAGTTHLQDGSLLATDVKMCERSGVTDLLLYLSAFRNTADHYIDNGSMNFVLDMMEKWGGDVGVAFDPMTRNDDFKLLNAAMRQNCDLATEQWVNHSCGVVTTDADADAVALPVRKRAGLVMGS